MITINIVEYNNLDFIQLCELLEKEHIDVIKEQRSPNGNCLNNLDKFKTVFVAYDNSKPVGCLAMKEKINDIVEVGRLYVLSEYRKKGIASMLFNNVFNKAKELKAKKVILDTYKRFESAIRLYKKLGFYEIDNYIDGSPHSVCMEKVLEGVDPNE
ncbi:MAG: GNAT family N-acetyltransferase [Bacilli bacterium]|nr:GNAT family N-acetyltransferase [Bacilli bacterium]